MQLIIFEDQTYENFYPLNLIRATFELKCGPKTLEEKIIRATGSKKVCYFARDYLTDVLKERFPLAQVNDLKVFQNDDLLLINGRWLFTPDTRISLEGSEEVGLWKEDGTVLYVRIKKETAGKLSAGSLEEFIDEAVGKLKNKKEIPAKVVSYPWDLMIANTQAITDEFIIAGNSGIKGSFHEAAYIVGDKSKVYVAPGANVYPNVTIDVTEGPVTIEKDALVYPGSFIMGPSYIGPRSKVLGSGARIREGTMLGPVCWVGGEIEETVAHGYLNNMHDGFLGHSYVGLGVNLGALCTNSDVKNDFSNVSVYVKAAGDFVKTGSMKVGSFIGDYTKTSIGTLFNTGSSIGLLSIILGGDGVLPKYIPSFSWYINRKITKGFGLGKAIEAANTQIARRNRPLTEAEVEVIKQAFAICKDERNKYVKRDRMN